MLEDEALVLEGTRNGQAHIVFPVRPVDANERSEVFLHVVSSCKIVERDMQSRTQRSRDGEPVLRLSLGVRCGRTRRRKHELVSIACSGLQIRRRRVHVPRPILVTRTGMESVNGIPMVGLQLAGSKWPHRTSRAWWSTAPAVSRAARPPHSLMRRS